MPEPCGLLDPVRQYLREPRCAVLSTTGPDGAPHQVVVHYLLERDALIVNGRADRHWVSSRVATNASPSSSTMPISRFTWSESRAAQSSSGGVRRLSTMRWRWHDVTARIPPRIKTNNGSAFGSCRGVVPNMDDSRTGCVSGPHTLPRQDQSRARLLEKDVLANKLVLSVPPT
jgi:hypothetical protein